MNNISQPFMSRKTASILIATLTCLLTASPALAVHRFSYPSQHLKNAPLQSLSTIRGFQLQPYKTKKAPQLSGNGKSGAKPYHRHTWKLRR